MTISQQTPPVTTANFRLVPGGESGKKLAEAAQNLLDTPFHLHGRTAQFGVDCIGLLLLALDEAGLCRERLAAIPRDYRIKGHGLDYFLRHGAALGFTAIENKGENFGENIRFLPAQYGDVFLLKPAVIQHHLAIATPSGFVHAHAGLGRVICQKTIPHWPVLAQWRLNSQ